MFEGVSAHCITWYNAGRVKENWEPLETIFKEIHEAGYDGVEYDKRLPSKRPALELQKIAAGCGLQWVAHSVSPPADPANQTGWDAFRKQIDEALSLGVKVVTSGLGGRAKTPEECRQRLIRSAESIQKAASICKESGVALAAHNHWKTLLENRAEIECLLELAPSANLLFDTAHLELCGGGVLDVIAKRAGRIAHVHLKDLDKQQPLVVDNRLGEPREWPNFKELGQGGLDFAPILSVLEKAPYRGWISVELDWAARDPLEAHKANRAHLRRLGY